MNFSSIAIGCCHRDANQVAHELAKSSFVSRNTCIWNDEPPSFLVAIYSNDVLCLIDQ